MNVHSEKFLICGIDEAGRGALAGPVFAGAVILKTNNSIRGIKDSKKLSSRAREIIFKEIKTNSISWAVGISTVQEIFEKNIRNASLLAMKRAVLNLNVRPKILLIDGIDNIDLKIPSRTIISGDDKIESISAASIIAKVSRDRYMINIDSRFPLYGFKHHKGYGTRDHLNAIEKNGVVEEHRKKYKPILKFL